MNHLKLYFSIIIGFLVLSLSVDALPPDLEWQSAIRAARKYINPKPNYTPGEIDRCFTDSFNILAKNWNRLPAIYQREFQGIFLRPGQPGSPYGSLHLPKKFDTPYFRFHYTTIGRHAPPLEDLEPMNGVPDYVDICADAMERSYRIEVDLMGFKQPYDDLWVKENGGNHKFDVYLFMFPALGFTTADWFNGRVLSTVVTWGPYFALNSRLYDFFGKSEGIRFLKTTAAHEFLHGIQFGYNAFMPIWFMEASATWIEAKVYDGGLIDDGDNISDPDELGETDAYNYFPNLLRLWFLQPDIALDSRVGLHEYASVIWVFYMAQRFNVDIVRQFYANTTDGSYREFGNFSQVFIDNDTTLAEAFKTFTVWNYFTHTRDDGKHYFSGHRFPPVAIHPSDVHRSYPVHVDFDSESMPEPFSSRYIVFEPTGVMDEFAVKIDGADLAPINMSTLNADDYAAISDELNRHNITGLRGWGAKFILEKSDGTTEIREAFTYQRSQQAQMTFKDFGGKIKKITLIIINLRPDIEHVVTPGESYFGGSVSYTAGKPPTGKLSAPTVTQARGGVRVQWRLEAGTDIREVVILRKRYTSLVLTDDRQPFQNSMEVLNAADRDRNGIPEDDINIAGQVQGTQTSFTDTTIFQDINTDHWAFDPEDTQYYYAVVPVSAAGIMGTPSIGQTGITPTFTPTRTARAPAHTRLHQSFPNPLNPDTWIPYELAEETPVSIEVYNIAGQLVRTLELGLKSPGRYLTKGSAAHWDGRTESGERASSGVYFYMLKTGLHVDTRKMVILK